MCVIIKRDPLIKIPDQKIISASIVNPDGWGLSVLDRGKVETRLEYKSGGNDPEAIIKALDDAKDHTVYLHLRFSTVGEKSVLNCHPFTVMQEGDYKIGFMHNGTISNFRDDKLSDTNLFAFKVLSPLLRAFKEIDGENVLANETIKDILERYRGASVFTLYDSNGQDLILENSSCKQFEGWWASNEYSFNRTHRDTDSAWDYNRYGGAYYNRNRYEREYVSKEDSAPWGKSDANTGGTATSKGALALVANNDTKVEPKVDPNLGHALARTKKRIAAGKKQDLTPPAKRMTFLDILGIDDIRAVEYLDEEELYDLVCEEPEAATALLMDLVWEIFDKRRKEAVNAAAAAAAKSDDVRAG